MVDLVTWVAYPAIPVGRESFSFVARTQWPQYGTVCGAIWRDMNNVLVLMAGLPSFESVISYSFEVPLEPTDPQLRLEWIPYDSGSSVLPLNAVEGGTNLTGQPNYIAVFKIPGLPIYTVGNYNPEMTCVTGYNGYQNEAVCEPAVSILVLTKCKSYICVFILEHLEYTCTSKTLM